jgi:hypothetical protein
MFIKRRWSQQLLLFSARSVLPHLRSLVVYLALCVRQHFGNDLSESAPIAVNCKFQRLRSVYAQQRPRLALTRPATAPHFNCGINSAGRITVFHRYCPILHIARGLRSSRKLSKHHRSWNLNCWSHWEATGFPVQHKGRSQCSLDISRTEYSLLHSGDVPPRS